MDIMVEFLLVSSSFPLKEVYDTIGIEGETKRIDEAIISTASNGSYVREKACSITYSTGYLKTIDVEEPIKQIISLLHLREEQIIQCIEKFKLQSRFCIVINLTDNPIIQLPQNFIDMASRLHADIEIDSYINYNRKGNVAKSWFNFKKNKKAVKR